MTEFDCLTVIAFGLFLFLLGGENIEGYQESKQ